LIPARNTQPPGTRRFWRVSTVLAAAGAIVVAGLGAAYLSIGHSPQPHGLPMGFVGPTAQAQGFEASATGKFSVRAEGSTSAAKRAIRHRDVYGAVVPSGNAISELLIAPAASNQAANYLRNALGQPTSGKPPKVVEVVPLPPDDSAGNSIGLLLQVLILGGTIGVVGMGSLVPRLRADFRHGILPLTFLVLYAFVLGLIITLVGAAFGVATDVGFGDRVLAFALISFAVTASTAALVALIGPAGSGVAALVYFLIGTQISGANTAPDFLPHFWRTLGEYLPPGAGATLIRNVFYFPDASSTKPITILAVYVAVGCLVLVTLKAVAAWRGQRPGGSDRPLLRPS
jgi:hypothetical protein